MTSLKSPDLDLESEPLPQGLRPLIAVGQRAPEFETVLTTGQTLKLTELAARGPVLLNFIKGTWCPFCQKHMLTLRDWQKSLARSDSTILVLSNEPVQTLRDWLAHHPLPYLFGSLANSRTVFESYGVDVQGEAFARPATFLVDKDLGVRMAFDGTRGRKLVESCIECGFKIGSTG